MVELVKEDDSEELCGSQPCRTGVDRGCLVPLKRSVNVSSSDADQDFVEQAGPFAVTSPRIPYQDVEVEESSSTGAMNISPMDENIASRGPNSSTVVDTSIKEDDANQTRSTVVMSNSGLVDKDLDALSGSSDSLHLQPDRSNLGNTNNLDDNLSDDSDEELVVRW